MDVAGNALPLIQQGKLKALAVTTEKRIPELPNVPTLSETLPGFVHVEWFAIVAPPKTAPATATRISQAITQTLRLPDVEQRLRDFVVTPVGSSPADLSTFVRRESERWRGVIRSAGLKAE